MYAADHLEESTLSGSTIQPPPSSNDDDDGTLMSETLGPDTTGSFEIGNVADEDDDGVDGDYRSDNLKDAGMSLPTPEELKAGLGAASTPRVAEGAGFDEESGETASGLRDAGMSLPDPEELKTGRSMTDGCCKMWFWMILVFICLISLTVGLVVGLTSEGKEEFKALTASFKPVTRVDVRNAMKTYIVENGISSSDSFLLPTSPQNMALDFLANEDPLQLNAPRSSPASDEGYSFVTRYAMSVFQASMNGDSWNYDLLFNSRYETCEWHDVFQPPVGQVGVLCFKETNTIGGISFISNKLEGTLPDELSALTTLTYLESIGNDIQGSIPDSYRSLTNLRTVIFAFNQLTGSIPDWIADWSDLEILYLSDNLMEGRIPDSFQDLQGLTLVALDDNTFTGSVNPVWELPNLEYAFLEENGFVGGLPDSIAFTSPSLINLDVSDNKLGGPLPPDLFKLTDLEILDIHGNSFSEAIPSDIPTGNEKLTFLAMHDNILSKSIPTQIGALENLQHLDLTNNKLTGEIPTELQNFSDLTYLFLGQNLFTPGPIPSFMYSFSALRELSLKSARRTGGLSGLVASLSNLVLLDLDDNDLTGPIPAEIGQISNLQFLLLNRNRLNGNVPSTALGALPLQFLLLDVNELTGNVDTLCDNPFLRISAADCDEVECTCCNPCCTDGEPCHDFIGVTNLDPLWEREYAREFFNFNNMTGL